MAHENTHPGDSKGHHTYTEEGYKAAEYTPQEYPKALILADGKERIVHSAEEEAEFTPKPKKTIELNPFANRS
jgi:hypothetical protein